MGPSEIVSLSHSILNFPKFDYGILAWSCWGFADGFIIGLIAAYLYKGFKKTFDSGRLHLEQ
jgi:hypothetical protein